MVGLPPTALFGPIRRACSLGLRFSSLCVAWAFACAAADITPPGLTSYTYAPAAIDTAAQPAAVNATVTATDESSGLDFALIAFESPTKTRRVDCLSARGGPSTGTPLSGGFTCTATFPVYSETGTWNVSFVQLADLAGNIRYWTTAELAARGMPVQLTVSGTADLTPPRLSSYSYGPLFADISTANVALSGTIAATDNLSGFQRGVLAFYSPSGSQRVDCLTGATPTSGTKWNGTWACAGTLPRYSETGNWTLRLLQLTDFSGNVLALDTTQLTAQGLETRLVVSGTADQTPPSLVTYTLSANGINTSTAPQTVTGTIRVSDDLSGVKSAVLAFYSASGKQRVDCVGGPGSWVSGTPLAGVLQCAALFPLGAEPGLWSIRLASVVDQAGNLTQLSSAQLSAKGLQLTITNQGGISAAASPASLSFLCRPFGLRPPSQSVVLSTTTAGAAFSVGVPASAAAWLTVSPVQGVTPATLSVTVDPRALAAGAYGATVDLFVTGALAPVKLDITVQVRSLGDFDGDNKPDLLWQNEKTRGATMWFMQGVDGSTLKTWSWIYQGTPNWRIVAMSDFDRNGVPDILWQEDTSRAVTIWYMGGARGDTLLKWMFLHPGALGWRIVGAADFDKNGTPDILWQNDATRAVTVWYMSGSQGTVMIGWLFLVGDVPGWKIVATADFDNNGTPDVIWQEDKTRMATIWYLGGPLGNQLQSWSFLVGGAQGWAIRGASDLDRNGTPDIVWQNDTTFDVTIWFMGGSSGRTLQSWKFLVLGLIDWRILVPA